MEDEFYRIKRLPPYVIAEVNAMRHAARQAGKDIIDLGMGNPDLPPPQHVLDKLCAYFGCPIEELVEHVPDGTGNHPDIAS